MKSKDLRGGKNEIAVEFLKREEWSYVIWVGLFILVRD